MIRATAAALLLMSACAPAPAIAPAPPVAAAPAEVAPPDLEALAAAHDWQYEAGDTLNAAWNTGLKALLGKLTRPDVIAAIADAGFTCIYGEAHEDYPDPAAVCTRGFATRACQMDWEITTTADKGLVDEVDGSFRRDCIGVDRDWPEPMKSTLDDQLAPMTTPTAPN